MKKPRLYDPRSGHRIDSREHRRLVHYAERKITLYDALAEEAHERGLDAKRRATRLKWAKRRDRLQARFEYWRTFRQILEDELKGRVEYEGKFPYHSKKDPNGRVHVNIRMRYMGKLPLPMDQTVKRAFFSLIVEGRAPKDWEYAYIDWRNDRKGTQGWHRGELQHSEDEKDLQWAGNIFVGGDLRLSDMETLIIGEVEED